MAFAIEASQEIWHRHDFNVLCNWRRLYRAAEVGVDRGEWARIFLDRWMGYQFYGIDAYKPYGTSETGGMLHDREADFLMAVHHLAPHAARAKLIRERSVDAADLFAPGSLDFVYIDGDHQYESVVEDIKAWWPKLSEPGILAGHDFDDQEAHAGVKRAVTEFAQREGLTVYITAVEGFGQETCPSWYLYRNGIPGPEWRRC